MPEVGLGIGRGQGTYRSWTHEWLYWFDQWQSASHARRGGSAGAAA